MVFDYNSPEEVEKRRVAKEKKRERNRKAWKENKKEADKGKRLPVSHVDGQKSRMQELRAKLLSDHNASSVLQKVLSIAYNDEHPGQMTALKMCFDRMLPQSMFEDKVKVDNTVSTPPALAMAAVHLLNNIKGVSVTVQIPEQQIENRVIDVTPETDESEVIEEMTDEELAEWSPMLDPENLNHNESND
jgi:hypothetical protein